MYQGEIMNVENTISKLFFHKTKKSSYKNAIGWIENNELKFFSNEDYLLAVRKKFHGLVELGLEVQDRVAILGHTSKEWHLFDMAALAGRAVVTPIYPTYMAHEIEFILNHSETKILILENDLQFKKLLEVQDNLTFLKAIVAIKDISHELSCKLRSDITFSSLDQLIHKGEMSLKNSPKLLDDSIEAGLESDIFSILYTSGTTGAPKGAVVIQKAVCSMLNNVLMSLKTNITPSDRILTFLPLSHVLGRCDSLLNLIFDFETVYAESLDKVVDNLIIARPTILIAVPRIFEKVYSKVLENIATEPIYKKKVFDWALLASNQYYKKISSDVSPSPYEIIQKNLAFKLVFEKIYKKFGGRIRFLISGGAPLAPEISTFLQNANLAILEGYGLTETIAPSILNPPARQIPGTIGVPLGDVQIKFAEDGEILLKTDALFSYYYKNAEATKEAFQDGWFLTGDIGELTTEGYVKITDRKKDIIITSAGKNVAPQKIENILKLQKHISNVMVVGDQRKFLTAVISIDREAFLSELDILDITDRPSYEQLAVHPKVYEIINEELKSANKELASYESIKGFIIVPSDFTIENGQMTPSLKLKKKIIIQTYIKEIDALYNKLENRDS
jgi:long-chain acyl-CoA synthetase